MLSQFKPPKDTDKISWTKHSIEKMKFYGLSSQRVLWVLNRPERGEQAVAPDCMACMQTVGTKRKMEVWVMYKDIVKDKKPHRKIISAWRYPGISPKRGKVPIPEDILEEIGEMINSVNVVNGVNSVNCK